MNDVCCVHQEPVLRATQYLPDIVRLQRRMFDMFNHRIDHRVAREKTMKQFIDDSWPSGEGVLYPVCVDSPWLCSKYNRDITLK